jgi:YegS/Rv2252/BmrU family lipid kinase
MSQSMNKHVEPVGQPVEQPVTQSLRVMIIFNPTAGQSGGHTIEQEITTAAEIWRAHNWYVDLAPTAHSGDGTHLARSAVERRYDIVVAAGGDGTINEVVNGIVGSDTALATLPMGTVNVWARELGLPFQTKAAAEALLSWKPRPIDVGKAGEHHFLLMAGVGFDAAITADVRPEDKRRFGALAYVFRGVERLLRIRGTRSRLVIDGRQVKGRVILVVIGNSQLYGGLVRITNRATIDDGLLDICVIKGDSVWSAIYHTFTILQGRYSIDPEIEYYRARTVTMTSRPSLPVQVDGDTIARTPITFQVLPGALQALLPSHLPDGLVRTQAAPSPRTRTMERFMAWLGHQDDQSK